MNEAFVGKVKREGLILATVFHKNIGTSDKSEIQMTYREPSIDEEGNIWYIGKAYRKEKDDRIVDISVESYHDASETERQSIHLAYEMIPFHAVIQLRFQPKL